MDDQIYTVFSDRLAVLREHLEGLERLLAGYNQAQVALHESEERFRVLVEQVQDYAIFLLDLNGQVTSWNTGAERIKGYTADEIIGQHLSRFYPAEAIAADEPEQALAVARMQGRVEIEGWRLRKDGTRFWANVVITALHDDRGKLQGFAKVTRDLTERKRSEIEREELLVREQAARAAAEQVSERLRRLQLITEAALAHLNLDDLLQELLARIRTVLHCDTVAVLLVDNAQAELVVRAAHGLEAEVSHGVRIPVGRGFAGLVAAAGRPIILDRIDETTVLSPILREKGVRALLGVPLIVQGNLLGVVHVGTLHDRPFTVDDSEFLQLAADRMALAIEHARLFDAERIAHQRADEAVQLRDQFVSVAAHELRTPLTTLLGNLQLLQRRTQRTGAVAEREQGLLSVANQHAERLSQIVNTMLDVSRIQRGRLVIDRKPVNIVGAVRQVVMSTRPLLQRHQVELRSSGEQLMVAGDELRLEQVVAQLLQNAVRFSPDGGVITVDVAQSDDEIAVSVSDPGIGIAPENLPNLFEYLYTVASPSTEHMTGLGVGLYMVREVVVLHGGRVEVQSSEGHGSVFTIRLPKHLQGEGTDVDSVPVHNVY